MINKEGIIEHTIKNPMPTMTDALTWRLEDFVKFLKLTSPELIGHNFTFVSEQRPDAYYIEIFMDGKRMIYSTLHYFGNYPEDIEARVTAHLFANMMDLGLKSAMETLLEANASK